MGHISEPACEDIERCGTEAPTAAASEASPWLSPYPSQPIPLAARIVFLCDIYDALRSRRPYKPAFDHRQTVDIMAHGDGRTKPKYFDPAMLAAFEDNHQSFRDIFEAHSC
jgi:hypothetical protein